jgi:hypothetical protein
MTQPIDPFRPNRWDLTVDEDPFLRPTSTPARPAAGPAPAPPPLPDTDAALLARATRKSSPGTSAAAASNAAAAAASNAAAAATPVAGRPRSPVQVRLDELLAASTLTLRTPEGNVTVTAGFWMGENYAGLAGGKPSDDVRKAAVAAAHLSSYDREGIAHGKASPQAVIRVAEVLIAQGHLPPARPGATPVDRVRQMMAQHRLGVDCAAYVHAGLAAAYGTAWERVHFSKDKDEGLLRLGNHGLKRIANDPKGLRPGDVISLQPRPKDGPYAVGHRVIVYDQHLATSEDLANLGLEDDPWLRPAVAEGKVFVLKLDSSWGAGGVPSRGGVGRRTWVYDDKNNRWYWRDEAGALRSSKLPYDHPLDGTYRVQNP